MLKCCGYIFLTGVLFFASNLHAFSEKKAYIFTINDFHGYVSETKKAPGAAKLATKIEQEKLQLGANDKNSIIVFAGDNYYGQAISNDNRGKLVSSFAKKIGIKLSSIGNHEFDWNKNLFQEWSNDSGVVFLNGNITDNEKKLNSLPKYKIVNINGIRICFIGVTTLETLTALPHYKIKHVQIENAKTALTKIITQLKNNEEFDLIIALSHIPAYREVINGKIFYGKELNEILAIQDINAFITGHSHELFADKNAGRPIIQAKKYGEEFGVLEITRISDKKFEITPRLVNVSEELPKLKPHPEIENIVKKSEKKFLSKFNKTIASATNEALAPRSIAGIDPLIELIGRNILSEFNVDAFLINAGSIREDISKGNITLLDIKSLMPFDDEFTFASIYGRDLKKIIIEGLKGFDDKGILQYYGLKIDVCDKNFKFSTLKSGKPLEDNKVYRIAITSHMYPKIDNLNFSPVFDIVNSGYVVRDYIIDFFAKQKIITFPRPSYYSKCGVIQ